jgi:hypothetical protein
MFMIVNMFSHFIKSRIRKRNQKAYEKAFKVWFAQNKAILDYKKIKV